MQFFTILITVAYVFLLAKTIKNNNNLNQRLIFSELVKQERELRIKLNEYRGEIHKRLNKSREFIELTLDYDTLLFNYYEYLAICLYQKLINEKETKLYFKDLLRKVKDKFESSILFEDGYANRDQYKVLLWLFKRWRI